MKRNYRVSKHRSIRRKISGTMERPRVSVFRSTQHIYAQVIDDTKGVTILAISDVKLKNGAKTERARSVGEELAKGVISKKIKKIVFDRGGFRYQGRVAALAEGLRKGGLEF